MYKKKSYQPTCQLHLASLSEISSGSKLTRSTFAIFPQISPSTQYHHHHQPPSTTTITNHHQWKESFSRRFTFPPDSDCIRPLGGFQGIHRKSLDWKSPQRKGTRMKAIPRMRAHAYTHECTRKHERTRTRARFFTRKFNRKDENTIYIMGVLRCTDWIYVGVCFRSINALR